MKASSVFFSRQQLQKAHKNIREYSWAADTHQQVVAAAQPWLEYSDDELWHMMFGPTLTRSWMVWSDGHCPMCQQGVPMYNWKINALIEPWKVRCPHCDESFPRNDFAAFYQSGLDERNIFDRQRADRSLLFNSNHPDPSDPLHLFGVDDGEGFVDGEKRWRFIGTYLVYGQWKQLIVGGIHNLAVAYVLTGDITYAHKTGVLLDRVADLYPDFDFFEQGVMYEQPAREVGSIGYVSYWCDACDETREMILAYDAVFEALRDDQELVDFLAQKAAQYKLENPKHTWEDVQRNIEERILREAIVNRAKIRSNYPRTDITVTIAETVLNWPDNRVEVEAHIDDILEGTTAVDGVTGEKGLSGYTAFAIQGVAMFLGQYSRLEPTFLRDALQRHPKLHQTYRFHIDTWCLEKYYPQIGDSGGFAEPVEEYQGLTFRKQTEPPKSIVWEWAIVPSMFTLLWDLYQITGDIVFVQVLYRANGNSVADLPHDLFADDPAAMQRDVQTIIEREGVRLQLASVDKREWHLAILRGGKGEHERAVWLDYDVGGNHAHSDGLNLGLFAYGLDLMPEIGYPAVHHDGYQSLRKLWAGMAASHNIVVVDGQREQYPTYIGIIGGETTLWAIGDGFQAMRASGPQMIQVERFERAIAMIDISPRDFYLIDIFRLTGGQDHAKFQHSHFGSITTNGLQLQPAPDYGHDTQMRNFQGDTAPQPGWSVDWAIEDRLQLLPREKEVHLRYTDLTSGAAAYTCEGWVTFGGFGLDGQEAWVPRVMVRRSSEEAPLSSNFVSVLEPYEGNSKITHIRRLPLRDGSGSEYSDSYVAIEVQLADGRRDLFVASDVENSLASEPSLTLVQPEWGLRCDSDTCHVRLNQDGQLERLSLCGGRGAKVSDYHVILEGGRTFVELSFDDKDVSLITGDPAQISDVRLCGEAIWNA